MVDEEKNVEQNSVPETPPLNTEPAPETQEATEQKQQPEISDTAELKEAIEKTDIDDSLKLQAAGQAQSVQDAPETERVKRLVEIASAKGIAYAVHVAKKTGDAYLVDALHDALAEDGLYKKLKL